MYISSGETHSRSLLSEKQSSVLMESFVKDPYPTWDTLRNVSEVIGLSEQKVYRWFDEERSKERDNKIKISTERK